MHGEYKNWSIEKLEEHRDQLFSLLYKEDQLKEKIKVVILIIGIMIGLVGIAGILRHGLDEISFIAVSIGGVSFYFAHQDDQKRKHYRETIKDIENEMESRGGW